MKKLKYLLVVFTVALLCILPAAAENDVRDVSFENTLAADLKMLGLFSGVSDTNFDLERAPSRTEALVMLIRLLGEEKAVKEGEWSHPFNDVADWADAYVGYAYENGLTKGISETEFGGGNASAATYLTFVLRALGFSDADGDFSWDNPYKLAKGLGLLPAFVDTENFWRADTVTVSYAALSANLKKSEQTLAEKLIEQAVFDASVYGANYDGTKITVRENSAKTMLSAEDVYSDCSPAVFYIEIQDANGKAQASGSGFFCSESGIAVTNYHVIQGAAKAVITLPGSGAKYDVTGIYDADVSEDWAMLKIDGEGFATIECCALPVKGGSNVYAIGSPEGLQNTVSAGLVSNSRRVLYGDTYIQTTAAISHGSSGGVLLNAYGEVIGITSNSIFEGQNLNFARPISVIADAKISEVTPLAEYNWNKVEYTYETTEVTVKEGETATYNCSYEYYTLSGESPSFSVDSSDYKIAGVCPMVAPGELLICGNSVGETTVIISDDLSDDVHVINVTVEANESAVPKVTYIPYYEEMKLEIGATKYNIVAFSECKLVDEPSDKKAASYTVKASSSAIKVEYEFAPEGEPYVALTVTASKKVTGNVTITNDITGDVLEIPVTVGNRYGSAYEEVTTYLITNGEQYIDDEDTDYNCYDVYFDVTDEVSLLASYYPALDELYFSYAYVNDVTTVYVSISLFKDGTVEYSINVPAANVSGRGNITPKTFTGSGKITFEEFVGAPAIKSQLAELVPTSLVSLLYAMDKMILPSMIPGIAVSDFGFVKVDYSLIGL